MSEVLVLIDHADGVVRKPTYELLTIAKRLGEPSAVFIGPADKAGDAVEAVKKYGAAKVYTVDDSDIKGYLVAPKAEALQIKEKADNPDDVKVIALCVGPEKGADAVRKALQMGADEGVHVTDEAVAGSDAIATSLVLAKAVEKIGSPELVVCGMSSTDGDMGVLPAMLAERLDLPQVTFASVIESQGDQVRVTSPSKDDLQEAMALLRKGDFGVELKFGNYR